MPFNHEETEEFARRGGYSEQRLTDRAIHEMLGLCRGVLCDGKVVDEEIVRLEQWCRDFPLALQTWPGDVLYRRIRAVLEDGVVDDTERDEFRALLEALTGQARDTFDRPTTLPLTAPPPEIVVVDEVFCLTGTFAFGSRRQCTEAIEQIGGRVVDNVSKRVHHLVIGEYITDAWIQSSYGRKIEKAASLRGEGVNISLVTEKHWHRCLFPSPR